MHAFQNLDDFGERRRLPVKLDRPTYTMNKLAAVANMRQFLMSMACDRSFHRKWFLVGERPRSKQTVFANRRC